MFYCKLMYKRLHYCLASSRNSMCKEASVTKKIKLKNRLNEFIFYYTICKTSDLERWKY